MKVGITMGDPSGIGPAIILKALGLYQGAERLIVIGDAWTLTRVRGRFPGKSRRVGFVDLANVPRKDFGFGLIRKEYGRASMEYIDKSLELLQAGAIDCLVTCPISKESIRLAGYDLPGHTEYLAVATGTKRFEMMLANEALRFITLTRHCALKNVTKEVSGKKLRECLALANEQLAVLFGIRKPRIVVCGVNPHASDNGVIGTEENRIIKPVIRQLASGGMDVRGPVPADSAIAAALRKKFDCVIAIYHDQALIPLKLTGEGFNITLGLPFVRTSPLHGTAFDIAGRPELANPDSFLFALRTAVSCCRNLKRA